MKKFETLVATNGIKAPFFGKKKFEQKWAEVRFLYEQLCQEVEELNNMIKITQAELQEAWDRDFTEEFEVVYQEPEFIFGNYEEAYKVIAEEQKKIKDISLSDMKIKLESDARKEWIEQIVSDKTEDCKLIVIRGKYVPNEDNKKKFENSVSVGKESYICIMLSPVWVAFDPQKEQDSTFWIMKKCTSAVEYIS